MKYHFLINIFLRVITGSLCQQTWSIYTYDISSDPSQTCDDRSYRCGDGSCIPTKYRCNGMIDCDDGGDERDCRTCPVNFCPCTDGLCIDISNRCNGKTDCFMESEDEENCTHENSLHKLLWNFYAPKKQCTFEGSIDNHNIQLNCSNMELVALPCVTFDISELFLNNNKLGLFRGLSDLSFKESFYDKLLNLKMENNQIEVLPPKMFENIRSLRKLSLADNQISHLDGIIFPQNLFELHLQNNKIKNLPPRAFEKLNWLTDLSVAYNQIEYLNDEIFSNLHSLKELNLTRNSIKTLTTRTFSGLVHLKRLDLSHNHIEIITHGTFHELKTLTQLYLNFNRITKLADGIFQPLTDMSELFLQYNQISIINIDTFNQTNCLRTLDLSHNKLTQLGSETFRNSIHTLILNNNHIVEIRDDAFSDAKHLRNLFINGNKITKLRVFLHPRSKSLHIRLYTLNIGENEIEEIQFLCSKLLKECHIDYLSLEHNKLKTLKSRMLNSTVIKFLKLNNNQIDTIEDYAFEGLEMGYEGIVFLNSNNLTKITSHAFRGIISTDHNPMSLKLNDNQIITIEDYAFGPFHYLNSLDLSSNALSKLTANGFQGVHKLLNISLQNNKIENIEQNSFNEMKHLEIINLTNNGLIKLYSNTFRGAYALRRLYLQINSIKNIERDAFFNLTTLIELNISYNKLTELRSDMFGSLLHLRELHLQSNQIKSIERKTFHDLAELQTLDLSNNMIAELRSNIFQDLLNLKTLSVRNNKVKNIEDNTFKNLRMLTSLDLSNNKIISLPANLLLNAENLKELFLQSNKIQVIDEFAFSDLVTLLTLNLKNNEIGDVNSNIFQKLRGLQYLTVDEFRLCCLKKNIRKCESPKDEFSSCEDLMKNSLLRTFVWILGITSIFANSFVIVFRIKYRSANTNQVNSFLIKNLAVSDSFMGIYLLIIAITDVIYRGEYYIHDKYWRESYWCNFAGFLSTLSSEVTVFILTILSIDRLYGISFPIRAKQRGISQTKKLVTIAWVLSAIISLVPLPFFNISYFKNFYGRSGVCLSLHVTNDTPPGWQYSVFVFIVLNAVLFVVIAVCYFSMFIVTTRARQSITSSNRTTCTVIAFRMTLLVMADAACWIPIITLRIRSLMGINPSPHVYPWIAVFVLPLNAALNPILYTISSIPIVIKVKFPNTRLNGRLLFVWPCRWVTANNVRKP